MTVNALDTQAGIIPTITDPSRLDDQSSQQLVVGATGHQSHTLTSQGHDASEDGTGRGTPIIAAPLTKGSSTPGVSAPGRRQEDDVNLIPGNGVRRLVPVETERLMSWPDGWTAVDGPDTPDSRRYAACGDGVVSNVAEWIGRGILREDTA